MEAIKALKKLASKPEGKPEIKPEPLKGLFSLLNLPVNATESDVVIAVTALKKNSESKSDNIDPALYAPVSVLSAVQNDYAELRRELAAIQQATTSARKEELIAANRDKLTNDEAVAWARTLPIENLEEYLKHIPSITALKQSQTKGTQPKGTQPTNKSELSSELSPEEMAICSQLGIGEDEFVKARGAK
jgi:phage I-like protein